MRSRPGSIEKNTQPFKTRLRHNAKFNSFLDDVCLEHGPIRDIGRFLLAAEGIFRRRGITLQLAPVTDLAEMDTAPVSCRPAGRDALASFALTGRTAGGQIEAALAAHIFASSAASPATVDGRGSAVELSLLWLAPGLRGSGLGHLLQRIGRCLALGHWNVGAAIVMPTGNGQPACITRAAIIDDMNEARHDLMAAYNAAHGLTPVVNGARLH